jgi:hypothetical protein
VHHHRDDGVVAAAAAACSFIFPILPIAHAYAGHFLDWAYRRCCVTSSASAEVASAPDSREGAAAPTTQGDRKKRRDHGGGGAVHASVRKRRQRVWSLLFGAGCVVLLLTHAGMAYYFSFWHQRSPIDVMHHLRHETQRLNGGASPPSPHCPLFSSHVGGADASVGGRI